MNKIKILHLLDSNKFSGAESVVCNIINLYNNDKNIEMVYCCKEGPIEQVLIKEQVPYILLKNNSLTTLYYEIKKFNPTIIHAHDFTASVKASIFSNKVISHIHCNPTWLSRFGIKSLVYFIALFKIKKVIGVSDSIEKEYIFSNFLKKKFHKIENFLDSNKILTLSQIPCQEFDNKFELIFLGRLEPEKNPIFFIEVVSRLIQNGIKLNAVIVGDGQLYNECKRKIKELNLTNNIKMLGFLDNPYPILKNTKFIIIPSVYEGFGLVAVEAMILETLVLCSGNGGLNDIVTKKTGYKCNDVNSYVENITRLHFNEKEYFSKINHAKKRSEIYTDKIKYKTQLTKMYHSIVGKRGLNEI